MRGGSDHNRQPECSATTPPVIGVNDTRRKPAASIIVAKAFGLGNFRIELDQILVSLAVAGHGLSNARNHLEGIKLIERIEARHIDRGKFEAQESAADLQDAIGLRKRPLRCAAHCEFRRLW